MQRFSFTGSGLPSLRGGASAEKPESSQGRWDFKIAPKHIQPLLASITRQAPSNRIATLANAPEFRVHKIVGDGRCMFRATVRSLALNKGVFLRPREELVEAEQLRQACHDALCRTSQRSKQFPDARKQILYGYGDLPEYCKQLARPTFWGGEVEMMVITKMLKIPIHVYTPDGESGGPTGKFSVIAKFGKEYEKPGRDRPGRTPVHLLYTGGCHYDLLIPRGRCGLEARGAGAAGRVHAGAGACGCQAGRGLCCAVLCAAMAACASFWLHVTCTCAAHALSGGLRLRRLAARCVVPASQRHVAG